MNKKQLKEIVYLRATSENPDDIGARLAVIAKYGDCDEFLAGECDNCNACEIYEVLNPEE